MRIDPEANQTQKEPLKILWVDDEPNILGSVRRLLRYLPVELVTFENPLLAEAALKEKSFDVIVSDQRMPEISGLEFLKRSRGLCPQATRIMVTGFLESSLVQEAVNSSGVFRFITKPWEEAQLRADIESALRHSEVRKRQRQLRESISAKTTALLDLNTGLEEQGRNDRVGLDEVRKQLRSKEEGIRDLARFLRELSLVSSKEDLVTLATSSLRKIGGIKAIWVWSKDGSKKLERWTYVQSGEVRHQDVSFGESKDMREVASRVYGRPILQLSEFPLMHSKSLHEAGIAVEHTDLEEIEESFLSSRIRALNEALERVLLEEHLMLAAKQWERTFDVIPHPVAIVDSQLDVVRANLKFEELGPGKKCFEKWGETRPCLGCPLGLTGSSEPTAKRSRLKIRGRVIEVSSYPVSQEQKGPALWVNHYNDLTEGERNLRGSIEREKMAALGKLAGDVAHQLKNPMAGVKGLVQIWIHSLPVNHPVRSDFVEILSALDRSEGIIRHLQDFVEGLRGEDDQSPLDLNDLVSKTIPLIKTALRRYQFDLNLWSAPLIVVGNFGLFQQVLLNLINNSIQSMGEGGSLGVKTELKGKFAALVVEDSGHGIPAEIQSRIFEPFFTTKKEGVGTGLGLSLTKEIVERFGGRISFDSKEGSGTQFRVEFALRKDANARSSD